MCGRNNKKLQERLFAIQLPAKRDDPPFFLLHFAARRRDRRSAAHEKWTNRLLVETGSSNTFSQFNSGLAVSMTDRFSVKLGFEARNNTRIPPGDSEHTDTITSANVVYDF